MLKLFTMKLEKLEDGNFEKLMKYVSKEKRERISRFVYWEDKIRALFGEMMLRKIISSQLHLKNSEIIFENNMYGKPYLKGKPDFFFNLSHSGGWIVSAISDREIGIDVELIQPISSDVAKLICSQDEFNRLYLANPENKIRMFYDIWTMKESFSKAIGKGLSYDLKLTEISWNHTKKISYVRYDTTTLYLKTYDLDCNHKMSVCSHYDKFPFSIKLMQSKDLIL